MAEPSATQPPEQTSEQPSAQVPPTETVTVETLTDTLPYDTVYRDSDTLYLGEEKVEVAGKDGYRVYQATTVYIDGVAVRTDYTDIEHRQPTNAVILRGTKPKTVASGTFVYPVKNIVTSYYGWRTLNGQSDFHYGIDLRAAVGTKIAASDGGKVAFAGTLGGMNASYGKLIIIDHENGFRTYYAHLSSFSVKTGDRVYQGQIIGKSGVTGNVTGPHLHFEIRKDGKTQDPLKYLQKY